MTAPVPTENYLDYIQCVREQLQLPPERWFFKNDPRYLRILEHTTQEEAYQSYLCAEQEIAYQGLRAMMVDLAHLNDMFGRPRHSHIPTFNIDCSAANGRYFWHAIVLLQYIKKLELESVNIIELGGGYGGLALYTQRLNQLFKRKVQSYKILDVKEVAELQNAYLTATQTNATAFDGLDQSSFESIVETESTNFVFSAYAFSEFDADMREWYVEHLMKYCHHGFIIWNFTDGLFDPSISSKRLGGGVYQFVPHELTIEPERPLIRPDQLFVSW